MTEKIPEINTGTRLKWNGQILRVNNLWVTKEGASARMSNASTEKHKKEEVLESEKFVCDVVRGGYYMLEIPDQKKSNPDYARVRYILGVFDNTISFREIWKSERHSGSFERMETHIHFQNFFKKARKITQKEYRELYRCCFNYGASD